MIIASFPSPGTMLSSLCRRVIDVEILRGVCGHCGVYTVNNKSYERFLIFFLLDESVFGIISFLAVFRINGQRGDRDREAGYEVIKSACTKQ